MGGSHHKSLVVDLYEVMGVPSMTWMILGNLQMVIEWETNGMFLGKL